MQVSLEDTVAGSRAAAAVVGELMVAGALEAGSPWAPLNAVAPLLLEPEAAAHHGWHPTVTPVGLAVTAAGIAGWAVLHRRLCGRRKPAERVLLAAASAAALTFFDYRLLPPERRPRFDRWLSGRSVAAKYAVLAVVLALDRPPR